MSVARNIGLVTLSLILGLLVGPSSGQQAERGGGGAQPDKSQAQQTVARFQQRVLQNVKQALGSNDDEFKVLEPKITRVMLLLLDQSAGFSPFGRRRGLSSAISAALPPSEVQKARTALRDVVDNKDATPAEVAEKLKQLREARAAARAELVQAQDDLRQFLTVRQEATLVSMGLLD